MYDGLWCENHFLSFLLLSLISVAENLFLCRTLGWRPWWSLKRLASQHWISFVMCQLFKWCHSKGCWSKEVLHYSWKIPSRLSMACFTSDICCMKEGLGDRVSVLWECVPVAAKGRFLAHVMKVLNGEACSGWDEPHSPRIEAWHWAGVAAKTSLLHPGSVAMLVSKRRCLRQGASSCWRPLHPEGGLMTQLRFTECEGAQKRYLGLLKGLKIDICGRFHATSWMLDLSYVKIRHESLRGCLQDALPVEIVAANRMAAVELADARQEKLPGLRWVDDFVLFQRFPAIFGDFSTVFWSHFHVFCFFSSRDFQSFFSTSALPQVSSANSGASSAVPPPTTTQQLVWAWRTLLSQFRGVFPINPY